MSGGPRYRRPRAFGPGAAKHKERREGRVKDALALGGDEGRDKLRKAAVRGKYPSRAADVRMGQPAGSDSGTGGKPGRTRGTETSHYPEEEKTTVMARVAASESAPAQTGRVEARPGLKDRRQQDRGRLAERPGKAGRSG